MNELEKNLIQLENEYSKSAKDFSAWMKNVKKELRGYSRSNITKYKQVGKGRPYNLMVKFTKEYIEYLEGIKGYKKPVLKPQKDLEKIELYYNKLFYLYFYDDDYDNSKSSFITRVILRIGKNSRDVHIKNVGQGRGTATDYVGEMWLDDSGDNLIFAFQTKITGEKNLHVRCIISPEKVTPIMLGHYANTDIKKNLINGTLVLEHIEDKSFEELESKKLYKSSKEYQALDFALKTYLFKKSQNRLKVPPSIFSYDALKHFLAQQKFKKGSSIDIPNQGIFIAAPISSLKEDYSNFKVGLIHLIGNLRDIYDCEVYFAGEHETKYYPPVAFDKNMNALNKLDKFILIYPESVVSSALLETGWALNKGKNCLFFVRNEEDLPYILRKIEQPTARTVVYETMQDIVDYFLSNKEKAFK